MLYVELVKRYGYIVAHDKLNTRYYQVEAHKREDRTTRPGPASLASSRQGLHQV